MLPSGVPEKETEMNTLKNWSVGQEILSAKKKKKRLNSENCYTCFKSIC